MFFPAFYPRFFIKLHFPQEDTPLLERLQEGWIFLLHFLFAFLNDIIANAQLEC